MNKAYYVIAPLLDPRYTSLSLMVVYARIDGSSNTTHIKRDFKTYLNVLIEWLQNLYNIIHGHAASEDSQDRERANSLDIFDVTSSNEAKFESTVRKEFFLYQKDCQNICETALY